MSDRRGEQEEGIKREGARLTGEAQHGARCNRVKKQATASVKQSK